MAGLTWPGEASEDDLRGALKDVSRQSTSLLVWLGRYEGVMRQQVRG